MDPVMVGIYLLGAFGFAVIAGHARITDGIRNWLDDRGRVGTFLVDLITCPTCLGFWTGIVAGVACPSVLPAAPRALVPIALALVTAGSNTLLGTFVRISNFDPPLDPPEGLHHG